MALIELTLEKPALKRTETTDGGDGEAGRESAETDPDPGSGSGFDDIEVGEVEESGGGRLGSVARAVAVVAVGVLGVVTIRRFRDGGDAEDDFDTDI